VLLTAALIVRDEERYLDGCLRSLEAVVDEVVVLDTGSVDATPDIARAHGARLYEEPWGDDFSRARNLALDRATGDWILYIDADERLQPVAREALERLLDDPDRIAYRVLLHPFEGSTPYREYRLWCNDPRIRFQGVIHEKVIPAIEAVAAVEGRQIADCELALDHVGYDGDQTRKHRRNLPLLRRQLAAEPDNAFNWRHLAVVLSALGQSREAEEALWQAVELARAVKRPDRHASIAYSDLVRMLHERGVDVRPLLEEALNRYPDNWLLVWTRARLEIDAGQPAEALHWLDRLAAVDIASLPDAGVAYDERLFGAFAQAARGLCLLRLGRNAEAAEAYRSAEAAEPHTCEHAVKRQLAELRAGAKRPPEPSRRGFGPSPARS
jgi:glycosyltransferase involved in cell wall biosynthesis